MRIITGFWLAVMTLAPATGAGAPDYLSITANGCGGVVRLVADDVHLSAVFKGLAEELGFELHFKGADRPISADIEQLPVELIESLTREDNIIVSTVADPDCDGGRRISKVRFLATGDPIVYHPVRSSRVDSPAPTPTPAVNNGQPELDYDEGKRGRRRFMTPDERRLDRERQRHRGGS